MGRSSRGYKLSWLMYQNHEKSVRTPIHVDRGRCRAWGHIPTSKE
ncbi:MAG: hypothetical protein ABSH25_03885 [Syntrophorhabdales bacterium]